MGPTNHVRLSMVALVVIGSLAGEKRIAETHPEPTVIVQADGPGSRAVSSNTLTGSDRGDWIIGSCSIPCSVDIVG